MSPRATRGAALCVAIADLAVYGLGCFDNWLQASDALWVVAAYAEPWRSLAAIAALALLYAATRRAEKQSNRLEFVLAAALSFALSVELGKGVHFHPVTGVVEVHHALIPLRKITLRATSEGVCVRPDLSRAWVWQLNQHRLWHLPLPKHAERFERQMLDASRAQYLSQPEACSE